MKGGSQRDSRGLEQVEQKVIAMLSADLERRLTRNCLSALLPSPHALFKIGNTNYR